MSEQTSDPEPTAVAGEIDGADLGEVPPHDRVPEHPKWSEVEHFQRRIVATATVLLAVFYVVAVLLVRGPAEPLSSPEARAYFAYLPSMVIDRDLDLTNQFEMMGAAEETGLPYGSAADGYAANPHSIGPALLWLPGYLFGVLVDRFAAWAGFETGPDGYGAGAIWGTALLSIALAGFAADLSRRVAAQLRGPEYALPATLIAWLGTAAITYTLSSPLHPQSAAWFCYALALWLCWKGFRNDSEWRHWFFSGAAFGLLLGMRPQNIPLLLVPIAFSALGADWRGARQVGTWALAGTFVGYLPAALVGIWLSGGIGGLRTFEWSSERLRMSLFSFEQGWLVATPLVALAIIGLVFKGIASRSSVGRRIAWAGIVAVAALVLLDNVAPGDQVDVPATLRFVSATPLLVLGLTQLIASIDQRPGLRMPGFAVLLALVAANLWLLLT